ncbi:hypothetical protein [Piscinibacter sp. XHJ-5]|uniref:hypothetical protein n=1 Tax=Piscinibacter sp. XHJ-5 TaxID=3037797 RepID=UPI002453730B|nr:hypothetical protein [Piscinibacter sp. XHJ-5]
MLSFMVGCGPAGWLQALAEPAVVASEAASAPRDSVIPARRSLPHRSAEASGNDAPSGPPSSTPAALPFSVVEIAPPPLPGMGPPARHHHALSFRLQAAEQAMRGWGVEASECSLQLRMPSKMAQLRVGASVDVTAQLRFGCRF